MHYTFGDCVLDTQRYVLHRAGQPIRLRPKVFQVLVYLLTHRERVVTKQEMSEQVWKGQAISDATLESTLAAVRRALGDQGRADRYIHTRHGHGYRFVAPVEECADRLPSAAGDARCPVSEATSAASRDSPQTAAGPAPPAAVGEHAAGSLLEDPTDGGPASQEAPPLDREPSSDAGERKLVSVLCCARGPMPELRASADLDSLHQQVRVLYDLVHGEALRYGGTVQPVVGERVLVVFGLPAAQEEHAQRAVLAALQLQHRLQQGPTHGGGVPTPWPSIRMSVHTGPVAVGGLGADEATALAVVGETVTQAFAIQDAAGPGAILCSEATARLVSGMVRLKSAAPPALSSLPTPVYQVLGLRARQMPIRGHSGQRLSPFVGRHQELATLQALLAQAEAGRRQVLGVVGEPGLGKSRLFYEFRHSLRERRLIYLPASCLSYAQATPYGPMRALLRRHCGISENDPAATIWAKVYQALAMAQSSYREAVGSFEQALRALAHLPEPRVTLAQAIDLRLALGGALRPLGDSGRILAALREAESLAVALNDPRRLSRISRFLSFHFYTMGAHDQAVAAAQRALTLATAGGDAVPQARANRSLGIAYQAQGAYRRAIDCFGQAVASPEGTQRRVGFGGVILPAVHAQAWLAVCHAELGTFPEGRTLGEEGLQIAEALAHPGNLIFASWGLGLLTLRQGDLPRALPLLERAVDLCQEPDRVVWFPETAAALGAAYILDGRIADAVGLLTPAMEQATAMEGVEGQVQCHLTSGEAQALAGRLEEAHTLAERALALTCQYQERGNQAYALRFLGEIAARHDPPEATPARAYYQQALALGDELGMHPLQAHCHHGLGILYAKLGRPEEARAELTAATDLYRAMEMTFWLTRAAAALVQSRGSPG